MYLPTASHDRDSPTPAGRPHDLATPDVLQLTAPAFPVVTYADVDEWLNIEDPEKASTIERVVAAATAYQEDLTNRLGATRDLQENYAVFPPGTRPFELLRVPLTPSPPATAPQVFYRDADGTLVEMPAADLQVYAGSTSRPAQVAPAAGKCWPTLFSTQFPDNVQVRYSAGHADLGSVPELFVTTLLLLVGHWWENREAYAPDGRSPTFVPDGWNTIVLNNTTFSARSW